MAIIGSLLKKGLSLKEGLEQDFSNPSELQKAELKKLMILAKDTGFGMAYDFEFILHSFRDEKEDLYYERFKEAIPTHDYNKIYQDWWQHCKEGKKNICWPGKIKYFALSSGTSESASKYIPVTDDILKSIRKTGIRQLLTLSKYELPSDFYTKGILMLGGSTDLKKIGSYFEGDLSGITTSHIPFWLQYFSKPGKKIARTRDWHEKLDEITKKAKDWDIGIIAGVPAWWQLLMEKIINHYDVNSIHDIWPNLRIFIHGGVSFEPYKKGFERLFSKEVFYLETYLASEGFIAFKYSPYSKGMKLVLNNGIFYEFIPFTDKNFDEDGVLRDSPETMMISDVVESVEYAILITTNAGSWRYLLGDVIKFTSVKNTEIVITGRTKHFLSLCGEHLSVDNMNKAIELSSDELNITIREFTVIGEKSGSLFAHRWFIGTDDPVAPEVLKDLIDEKLKLLNDDYKVERTSALKEVNLEVLPSEQFYRWLEIQGKIGGQNKFPRVLKGEKAIHWQLYLSNQLQH